MPIKVFIDQGHNPSSHNQGAEGNGYREQDITYIVGLYLNDLLNADPEFVSMVSRRTQNEVLGYNNSSSLQERVRMANEWDANYFISIHTNGSLDPSLRGTEIFVTREYSSVYWLAEDILDSIVDRMGMHRIGVFQRPSLYVLRETNMPALLIELGFISNYSDSQKMVNDPYGFAYAIYQGMLRYFRL